MHSNWRKSFGFLMQDEYPWGLEAGQHYGISLVELQLWKLDDSLSSDDLKALSELEIKAFYRTIWDRVNADSLPPGVDYFAFDSACQCGPVAVERWLVANREMMDAEVIIPILEAIRRRALKSLPEWSDKCGTWTVRITRAKKRALKMVKIDA